MSGFDHMKADSQFNEDGHDDKDGKFTHYIDDRLNDPAYFDGVRTKRIFAFLVDYLMIAILHIPFAIIIALLGVLTLGAAWLLFAILTPLIALIYVGSTMGGPDQATPGMKMMGIRIARLDGNRVDFMTAIIHGVIFWAANLVTSGFILLISLFTNRKRLVQDLLLGTVVYRSDLD